MRPFSAWFHSKTGGNSLWMADLDFVRVFVNILYDWLGAKWGIWYFKSSDRSNSLTPKKNSSAVSARVMLKYFWRTQLRSGRNVKRLHHSRVVKNHQILICFPKRTWKVLLCLGNFIIYKILEKSFRYRCLLFSNVDSSVRWQFVDSNEPLLIITLWKVKIWKSTNFD